MEFMANLQSGLDELKPSLFEILSEQQLSSLLPPSLRFLLVQATHRHPRYFLRVLNSFDELYSLLMLIVERYYLRTYAGSFTEHFYGLKRERVLRTRGASAPRAQLGAPGEVREALALRNADVWRNLAVLVGLPYLKRKLDEGYEVHGAARSAVLGGGGGAFRRVEELPSGASVKDKILFYYRWFLRRVYPSVNAAYHFSLLAFNLAYLFDSSSYPSPFLWLIGTRIRRMGESDHSAIAAAEAASSSVKSSSKPARPGQTNSIFSRRALWNGVTGRVAASLKLLLPTAIFALKFLEWWHASDFARQLSRKAAEGLELPPPVVAGLSSVALATGSRAAGVVGQQKDGKGAVMDTQGRIEGGADEVEASGLPFSSLDADKEKGSAAQVQGITSPGTNGLTGRIAAPRKRTPPISSTTLLPIFTVAPPSPDDSKLCPICGLGITNPTASPAGYVYCYVCIHRWVQGTHERQMAFMEGSGSGEEGWGDEEEGGRSREGRWESGMGRDAVCGRRVLGGTEVLRRVVV